jgi:hypothetical protein
MTEDRTESSRPRLELSGVQVLGGAMAAATSAVAASSLGVAGTLVGAALGSAVATVGGSLYTYSLRTTSERVRTVVRRTPESTVVRRTPESTVVRRGNRRRWAPIGAATAAFVLAMGGVSAAELVAGEPLSTAVYGQPSSSSTTVTAVVPDEPEDGLTPELADSSPTPRAEPGDSVEAEEVPVPEPSEDEAPGDEAEDDASEDAQPSPAGNTGPEPASEESAEPGVTPSPAAP